MEKYEKKKKKKEEEEDLLPDLKDERAWQLKPQFTHR